MYNSNKKLLFKLNDIQQVVSVIKKYYFGDYKAFGANDEKVAALIKRKTKSNKALRNKTMGSNLLIDYK